MGLRKRPLAVEDQGWINGAEAAIASSKANTRITSSIKNPGTQLAESCMAMGR
jgi:hypothetical protein